MKREEKKLATPVSSSFFPPLLLLLLVVLFGHDRGRHRSDIIIVNYDIISEISGKDKEDPDGATVARHSKDIELPKVFLSRAISLSPS